MFPTAHSTIHRNSEGEVTGWDTPIFDDLREEYYPEDREPRDAEDQDPATCEHPDRDLVNHDNPNEAHVICIRCSARVELTDEDRAFWFDTDNDEEIQANAARREADLDSID